MTPYFLDYKDNLISLLLEQRRNYINNTLPICSENIVVNPSAWNALLPEKQNEFYSLFWGSGVLETMEGNPINRLHPPSFDLFEL